MRSRRGFIELGTLRPADERTRPAYRQRTFREDLPCQPLEDAARHAAIELREARERPTDRDVPKALRGSRGGLDVFNASAALTAALTAALDLRRCRHGGGSGSGERDGRRGDPWICKIFRLWLEASDLLPDEGLHAKCDALLRVLHEPVYRTQQRRRGIAALGQAIQHLIAQDEHNFAQYGQLARGEQRRPQLVVERLADRFDLCGEKCAYL